MKRSRLEIPRDGFPKNSVEGYPESNSEGKAGRVLRTFFRLPSLLLDVVHVKPGVGWCATYLIGNAHAGLRGFDAETGQGLGVVVADEVDQEFAYVALEVP